MVRSRTTVGLLLYLEFFEDYIRRHGGDQLGDEGKPELAVDRSGALRTRPTAEFAAFISSSQLNSKMLSQLAHHTTTILRRSRLFAPWPPSTLGAFHFSPIFRGHSWSSQSQPANWSHLNDIYSKVVDVKPKETLLSPEERWAVQSRARMANLTPPKGPYAGRVLPSVEPHDFLIYH
jgi:hypothetical protein